jgi:hypothetical protein
MNYIIRIIDSEGEIITHIKTNENPPQSELDELVERHGGSYADISRQY